MVESALQDIRYALRALRARPSYAVVTVITLALVIGAATAVLAVVNATMIRPLPYPHADRLVRIYLQPPGTTTAAQRNPLSVRAMLRMRGGGLQEVDAVEGFWTRDRALGGDGEPESVPASLATAGALPLLGGPLLGRAWTEDEDRANARLVVISHGLWQRRFGGDSAILGRRISIDREAYEVIGVMPPAFHALYLRSELWTPINLANQPMAAPSTFISAVARLRPGATRASLHAALQGVMAGIVNEAPAQLRGWGAGATSIRDAQFGAQRPALFVLLAAVAALSLIACANLANVTLAQVMSRRAETGLRAALGASRGRVIRLQTVESLLLAAVGGGAGLLLGGVMLPALLSLDPQTARTLGDVRIDWRVQGTVAAVAALVALLAGVLPLVRDLRGDVARSLADGNRRSAGSRRDDRFRRVLVGAETALTVVLLVAGALLLSAFQRSAHIAPGFDPQNVLGAQIRLSATAYPTDAARTAVVTRILDRVRNVAGVTSAATTMNLFVPGAAFITLVHIDGRPSPDGQAHTVQFRRVSPEYFQTLRIPLLRGRDFAISDGAEAPAVAIVSRSFAERHWPGQDPIGRGIVRGTPARVSTVVGIVGDVSDVGFGQPPEPTMYLPYPQSNPVVAPISLVVRTAGDPLAMAASVKAAVFSIDVAQPIDSVTSLERFLADSLGPQRFRSTLLLVLAAIGLLLAAVGIYGVTARAVQERTREVGVRLALGAAPSSVWRLVVRQALYAVGVGMAVGLVGSAGASAAMIGVLPGVERAEAWTAVPAVFVLALASLVAAAVPAARAARVNPIVALTDTFHLRR